MKRVQGFSDTQHLHDYLEWKAELAFRRESAAQKRLPEAEADLKIRRWEQKSAEIALYETHGEPESQRLELHQVNQWAVQARRKKINLCGEREMRNRLHREGQTRTCHEIEELGRICREKTNQVRQLKTDALSLRQEKDPNTVSQLLTQVQKSQNQVNSFEDAREFHDLDTASSSGASHVPGQPLTISEFQRNA